jgi:hypothetical protein
VKGETFFGIEFFERSTEIVMQVGLRCGGVYGGFEQL